MTLARVLVAAFATVIALPAAGHASEGERSFAVVASYAAVSDTADGGDLAIRYCRGIGEQLWLCGAVGGGAVSGDETVGVGHGIVGFKYLLSDIVKYVPYATLGAGAAVLASSSDTTARPRLELGLGVDVLRGGSFAWGLETRLELASPRAAFEQSALFTAGLRVAWRWGFF